MAPPAGATIAELIAGRDWLFAEESYHIDISHLASVVRMSVLVTDPEAIAMAADLTEYGRRLSPRLQFEGVPPFERIFDDHGIYLRRPAGPRRRGGDRPLPGQARAARARSRNRPIRRSRRRR